MGLDAGLDLDLIGSGLGSSTHLHVLQPVLTSVGLLDTGSRVRWYEHLLGLLVLGLL